eukprot:scaffold59159_cov54-Phaeocystis_antarctica.AAC.2
MSERPDAMWRVRIVWSSGETDATTAPQDVEIIVGTSVQLAREKPVRRVAAASHAQRGLTHSWRVRT